MFVSVCRGVHDLAILLESNDAVGPQRFEQVKNFVKEVIDGFSISPDGTHVAAISFGEKASIQFKLNSIRNPAAYRVKDEIDRISFQGGGPSSTSSALQLAFDELFTFDSGLRGGDVNKVAFLVIFQSK